MPLKNCDVALVGEIYIDHIFTGFGAWPQPGEEVFTRQYKREIGGGAINTACGLARLGRSVALVGVIGKADEEWFEARLAEFGVTGEEVRKTEGNTGVTVSVSMQDDRSFFTYIGDNELLPAMLSSEAALASLERARHIHFALPLERSIAMHLLPRLHAAGCTTSLDVGFNTEWLADPDNLEVCRATDYLLPNEREASVMCGGDAANYLTFSQQNGFPQAVIKLGARGAAMIRDGVEHMVSSPLVNVVDTTGAGDAFNAGFIDALLDQSNPDECLRRACICGSLSTRAAGSLSALPVRAELEKTYEQTYTT